MSTRQRKAWFVSVRSQGESGRWMLVVSRPATTAMPFQSQRILASSGSILFQVTYLVPRHQFPQFKKGGVQTMTWCWVWELWFEGHVSFLKGSTVIKVCIRHYIGGVQVEGNGYALSEGTVGSCLSGLLFGAVRSSVYIACTPCMLCYHPHSH